MKPQKQLFLHKPEEGIYGDCHRTAIAICLNLEAKDIPHFMDGTSGKGDAPGAWQKTELWLNERGLTQISIPYPGETPLDAVLATVSNNSKAGLCYILGGESKTGVNHSVVCRDGEIACDPSLSDSGIVGPCDDGYYWITFFGSMEALS